MISVLYFFCQAQDLAYGRHANISWMDVGCTTCNTCSIQSFRLHFNLIGIDSLCFLQKLGPFKCWRGTTAKWGTASLLLGHIALEKSQPQLCGQKRNSIPTLLIMWMPWRENVPEEADPSVCLACSSGHFLPLAMKELRAQMHSMARAFGSFT